MSVIQPDRRFPAEPAAPKRPVRFSDNPVFRRFGPPFRAEVELRDCEVEGEIPEALNGAFYRVGPDYQYPPKCPDNIPFDGEGHVAMFRICGGHVDFRSRYVRTQRYKAQEAARRSLFGMYRNPATDDASVKGLSRGTANTHVLHHAGKLMALKEDSPPVVLDPNTLATLDDRFDFGGQLASRTFTAHPKFDPHTGEMLAFGYEATGEASDDVAVYAIDRRGRVTWEAWIKVPYVGMLHDFAVTQTHIAFLVIPMATSVAQMKLGGVHFAWDSALPSWLGIMRRGGDGKDIRWLKGPERCATHVMGAFSEGERIYLDMDMARKNQFPFFPNANGEPYDPVGAEGRITRLSADLSRKSATYDMEVLFPHPGILPRQDDRYHTVPYRYGFMPTMDATRPFDERLANVLTQPVNCWTRFDHATRSAATFFAGPASTLQECCFVPRARNAPEGDGYLIGIANRLLEGRSDLVLVDTLHMEDGAVAAVRLPFRLNAGIHGWWLGSEHLAPFR
ncbi:MAG TPA: carotenoid oxygenase family protein [Steroidobacteraceae bacterium]|nr:carotenoid oxygenase family protein [Steroidobacteraceae bacterium]